MMGRISFVSIFFVLSATGSVLSEDMDVAAYLNSQFEGDIVRFSEDPEFRSKVAENVTQWHEMRYANKPLGYESSSQFVAGTTSNRKAIFTEMRDLIPYLDQRSAEFEVEMAKSFEVNKKQFYQYSSSIGIPEGSPHQNEILQSLVIYGAANKLAGTPEVRDVTYLWPICKAPPN